MKYQIIKSDKYNWTIQYFQTGGEIVQRGRYAGQPMRERWIDVGYYPNLADAARALLDKAAGDAIITGEANTLLDAINKAETKVLEILQNAKEICS
jgi:hypothetical protein